MEKLVRIHLLQRRRIHYHGFDVARDRNHRSALFARIHQSVEKVDNARSRCSANGNGCTGEVSICDSGEDSVFFISNMHKLDVSV